MDSGDVAAWAGVIVGAVGVWVAYSQLSGLNATLRMNGLMAVLQIEAEMNSRKEKLNEISYRIRENGLQESPDFDLNEILDDQLDASIENYLNSVDRLAFCVLKEYLLP